MTFSNFDDLQTKIQALYHASDYAQALALVIQYSPLFPEQFHLLGYWQAVLAARTGDLDQALQALQSVLNQHFWYGEVLLRKSPSFKALQGDPAFERLVELNRDLRASDEQDRFPLLTLRAGGQCQAAEAPCPLLIGLHANGSNAQETLHFWHLAANNGWLVALPQSSQAMWKGAYAWDDRQLAGAEVSNHLTSLQNAYTLDPARIVLGGHSMGGETAIWMTLFQRLSSCGFVAFGPGGPLIDNPEEWQPLIQAALDRAPRGYIILGEADAEISYKNIQALVGQLNQQGVPCGLEIIPDAGHEFEPAYAEALLHALAFVTKPETVNQDE